MRNGLGVMADMTCGELLGMAQLSMPLGLSAALDIAVEPSQFSEVLWFVLQTSTCFVTFFATRKGGKS